jgi:hypothetical protein
MIITSAAAKTMNVVLPMETPSGAPIGITSGFAIRIKVAPFF